MKLLLDANLSWRLCTELESAGFGDVDHVDQIDLHPPAKDSEIWEWALEHEAMIITNDEDYYQFSLQKGFPPKVVILRLGNQSTKRVKEILITHVNQLKELYESTEYGVLELF